jgi:hypothetical protein
VPVRVWALVERALVTTRSAEESADAVRRAAAERRRLAEVFGDVLPESTGDDVEDEEPSAAHDDDLLRDVPPHHGG